MRKSERKETSSKVLWKDPKRLRFKKNGRKTEIKE